MVDQKSWVHVLSVISRGCVWEIDVWVLPALLQRLKGWGGQPVSAQTICRTLHQIGLHGCRPRRKPWLKMMHKKARKQFVEDKQTKDMELCPVVWGDQDKLIWFRWCQVCVAATRCGVQRQVCLGSGAAWVLPALGSYSSLREPWMPACTVTYWSRAWSPPFGDWAAGQYSNTITTTTLLKSWG